MTNHKRFEEPKKLLLPKVVVVFKLLFNDMRNIDILIDFLKSVLDLPESDYEVIALTDSHLKRERPGDKLGIVDVKLTTGSGKIVNIEMQVLEQACIPERIAYYTAKALTTQLKEGESYDGLKKTISIVIAADFKLIKDSPEYHHMFQLRDAKRAVSFTDIVEIRTLELQKLQGRPDHAQLYDWMRFFRAEKEEEFEMCAENNPMIQKAYAYVKQLSEDEEKQLLYEDRLKAIRDEQARTQHALKNGFEKGMADGIAEGMKKGMREERIQIARNLLALGLALAQIAESTGLTLEEVKKLKDN